MATERRGQAMIELALGMFALALVAAALFAFVDYIVSSLDQHRTLRARAGRPALNAFGDRSYSSASGHDTVEVDELAAKCVFGQDKVEVHEEVHVPSMGGLMQ